MKKFLGVALASAMVLSLVACGSSATTETPAAASTEETTAETTEATEEVAAEATATVEGAVALVTDVGTLDDESFNQASWEGVKNYCEANGINYQYFQPQEDSTEERLAKIDEAVAAGYNVIVMPGYLFGEAASTASETYPDVKFIAIDVSEFDLTAAPAANLYTAVFCEEQAGYLAGYAAVKDGYTDLGFLGGMAVPAVVRYGYGFLYGADAAAAEMGETINVKYTYGGQFFGDANITAKMEGWYSEGTQVVFACGGGIYTSAVEAALNHDGMVIGVDVDQHSLGKDYAYNPFLTSAMKGLTSSVESALDTFFTGNWDSIGGQCVTLGLTQGDFVGIATADDSWEFKTFTQDEYNTVLESIKSGAITISNDSDAEKHPELTASNVEYID